MASDHRGTLMDALDTLRRHGVERVTMLPGSQPDVEYAASIPLGAVEIVDGLRYVRMKFTQVEPD